MKFLQVQEKVSSRNQRKPRKRGEVTEIVDRDPSIAEPAGGLVGVEVSAVRKAVRPRERPEETVGATVDGGVAEHKQGGGERMGARTRRSRPWR